MRADSSGRKRQGRYELGELLGRGGMAEVFAGHSMGDHGFQKPVAIKRLLPELASDHVFVERLIDEAKILVGMQHGNIVSVLDLAREGEDVFLVMEYVDGPSLRQLIKARGQRGISLGIASYVLAAAAQGLEFAHTRPSGAIIHADISPSNLLLTTSGEVRVADFGIARREGGAGFGVEGKWAYMAPEQARGEALGPWSDVFALGVVMYELLTGVHPFGRQITADGRAAEPLRVIPPRVVRANVPAGLDAICMRCLAVEPRDRYARMKDLIDAITDERFANGYREGASDLAAAIAEVGPVALPLPAPARTQTARPATGHTIVTRSLLSQSKHAEPERQSGPVFAQGTAARNATGEVVAVGTIVATAAPARRTRWGLIILGAAVLAGGGVAVAMQMGPSDLPPAAPVAGPIVEPIPMPIVIPAPAAPVPVPVPVPVPAPVAVAPLAPTPAPVRAPIAAPPVVHHERPSTPAAKPTGSFRLSTTTWAYASIDGGPQQEVSMVKKFSLPIGRHTVRIFNDDLGLKSVSRPLVIEANKNRVWKVDLESGSVKEID